MFLICHRKLAIVLIAIGKGKSDDVISCIRDVDLDARGRDGRGAINWATCGRGYFNGNLAEVFCEHNNEVVAVKSRDNAAAFVWSPKGRCLY